MDALTRRYKLRGNLVKIRQVERGRAFYIYKVVETQDYYHIDELQHAILSRFDGTRTFEEVVEAHNASSPALVIDLEFLTRYVDSLQGTRIFEQTREERRGLLLERLRDERRRTASSLGLLSNPFHISVSAWDPDAFFTRAHPPLRFFFTPAFVSLSALSIMAMLAIWMAEWDRIRRGTIEMFSFQGKSAADLVQFFLILLVVGFIHECAHGLTTKHFGGEVRRMGFMFVYFTPCFFVDVSDSYLFNSHAKRQWVIFAGGYIELFICSLATFVWELTAPGTLVNDVSYKLLLMTGLTSIIVNYNPLIKLDGYYALMDFLEISELWESSFAYTGSWVKKNIFRVPVEIDAPTRQVRRIFLAYCLASVTYKTLLLTFFLTLFRNVFVSLFGGFGYVVLALVVLLVMRQPLLSFGQSLKFAFLDKKEVLMQPRTKAAIGAFSAFALALLVLLPIPIVLRASCVLEPRASATARPTVDGFVERILVGEGQQVRKGDVLAILRNERISRTLGALEAQVAIAEHGIAEAAARDDRGAMAKREQERDMLREESRALEEKTDGLTLRTPIAGTVVTPRLGDRVGTYLEAGGTLCEIAGPEGLLARVPVREDDLDRIHPGQRVGIKVNAFPYRTFPGTVVALAPASGEGAIGAAREEAFGRYPRREFTEFEAIVSLASGSSDLRQGMGGLVRIDIGRGTIAAQTARALRRWIGALIW